MSKNAETQKIFFSCIKEEKSVYTIAVIGTPFQLPVLLILPKMKKAADYGQLFSISAILIPLLIPGLFQNAEIFHNSLLQSGQTLNHFAFPVEYTAFRAFSGED